MTELFALFYKADDRHSEPEQHPVIAMTRQQMRVELRRLQARYHDAWAVRVHTPSMQYDAAELRD